MPRLSPEPARVNPREVRLGGRLFAWRDLLPVPLVLALLAVARPRGLSWLIGLPLIALGEGIRCLALRQIGPTTRTRQACADRLITDGIYSHVRHPLYLANVVKVTGILVVGACLPLTLLALPLYLLVYLTIATFEEDFLASRFGATYTQWAATVPRLLPRLAGTLPTATRPTAVAPAPAAYGWREVLRSERRTFGSTGLILAGLWLAGLYRQGVGE